MQSYDYAHRSGILELSWTDFAEFSAELAGQLSGQPIDLVVGVARAGLFPATLLACMLRCELFPVRLTRRLNDEVVYKQPVWKVPVPPEVSGKVVAIVDEIVDTGETLSIVRQAVIAQGAKQVRTACLVSHSWAQPLPDFCARVSDALVVFPWDRRVLVNGDWQLHPELSAALKMQGKGNLPQTAS